MTDRKRKRFEDDIVAVRPAMLLRAKSLKMGKAAEDVVQEAYLVALSHEKWAKIERPGAWMLGIVDRIALNWKRRMVNREEIWEAGNLAEKIDEVQRGNEVDTLDRMIAEEDTASNTRMILDAITQADLTKSEEYVLLARLRGMEYDEIAEMTGLGRESCVTYYSNAICKIRRSIENKSLYKTDQDQGDQK